MDKSLIDRLRELMKTDLIEVSYFAAGVLAHMTTDGEEPWSVDGVAHTDVLKDLVSGLDEIFEEIVGEWAMPDAEMVAYRTFQPFFPLLRTTSPHAVQLWALWAMLHVCKWNPTKYCPMMVRERGDNAVRTLALAPETEEHPMVKSFSVNILALLAEQGLEPGTTKYYFMSQEKPCSMEWHACYGGYPWESRS
ncbi:unnamed protein product [Notodromas monacha]|uniref:Protein zer-1 homolog-like C-terminal domain-containing protein n=1 Tax=Notodromas monacha TaxID=399045 RepID=A0A7R9BNB6_9CRUS|nr:unnamed protein product [Notodromas monacha]CAG0918675.1 unnamed protein product [Notodromas monacha]